MTSYFAKLQYYSLSFPLRQSIQTKRAPLTESHEKRKMNKKIIKFEKRDGGIIMLLFLVYLSQHKNNETLIKNVGIFIKAVVKHSSVKPEHQTDSEAVFQY